MELLNGLKKIDLNKIKKMILDTENSFVGKHYIVKEAYAETEPNKNGKVEWKLMIQKNSALTVKKIEKNKVICNIQGYKGTSNIEINKFKELKLEETTLDEHWIKEHLDHDENEEYKKNKKCINDLSKKYPEYKTILNNNILRDAYTSKGNNKSVTGEKFVSYKSIGLENIDWLNNKNKTNQRNPHFYRKNRSVRTTYYPTEKEISNYEDGNFDNINGLIPLGIEKNDYCSLSESNKIFTKFLHELCGFKGINKNFINDVYDNFYPFNEDFKYFNKNYKHLDYANKEWMSIDIYEKNTQTSKENGGELCHINPNLEYPTVASNVTLGTSSTNRKQSGTSPDYLNAYGPWIKIYYSNCPPLLKEEAQTRFLNIDDDPENLKRIWEIYNQIVKQDLL